MNRVQRTKGIRKIVRKVVLGAAAQKYVSAGNYACNNIMQETRSRQRRQQQPGPSDSAILAWARFDLCRELLGGFWEARTA